MAFDLEDAKDSEDSATKLPEIVLIDPMTHITQSGQYPLWLAWAMSALTF